MISSNTRATRSRYSSPAQTPQTGPRNGNGSGNGGTQESSKGRSTPNETSKSFMHNWLEPSVQNKPSYEEAGLMRYGVLENMAPLGTMPKPKKSESGQPVRRIVLRPPGYNSGKLVNAARESSSKGVVASASSPPPALATPAAVPTSPVPASAPPPRKALPMGVGDDDTEDAEYAPKEVTRRKRTRRVSGPAAAAPASAPASAAPKRSRRSSGAGVRKRSISISTSRPITVTTPRRASRVQHHETEDKGFIDKVIEAAVDEALDLYRYPTAWAIRTLYDEKAADPDFTAMIEDVFQQTADAATMSKFRRLIAEKKREGKRDNQGCYYFVPPATNSRFTPHKPKPAPYAKLIHRHQQQEIPPQADEGDESAAATAAAIVDEVDEEPEQETRAPKKVKMSHPTATPRKKVINGSRHSHSRGHGSGRLSSRKRARRTSHSSDSSLTSAMSMSSPDGSVESLSPSFRGGAAAATAAAIGTGTGTGAAKPNVAPKPRPIKTRGKSVASKQAVSNTSEPNSPTLSIHPKRSSAVDARMPGRLAASELFPNLPSKVVIQHKHEPRTRFAAAEALQSVPSDADALDNDDGFWDRRRDARMVTNGYSAADSSVRGSAEQDLEQQSTPARNTRKTRQSLLPSASTRATRSASKRPNDDAEGASSPVSFSFQGDASSAVGSRAATPTNLRPAKKQRSGLRIKSSPVKKKGGTAAGVPRSTGESQQPPSLNGAPKEPTADNDEYCSACGNSGDVLCCDGCPRSFHFECVDMSTSESLPDEWYCNECLVRRWPSRVPVHRGVFGSALNNLEKSIPRAFSLPKRVQNRFEGVKAGADGDYEEISSNRLTRKKNGYEEIPDFFKQREDGQAVLCHLCQKPATDIRAIIPCSSCSLHWHIDCLDPPLAVPPVLKTWRCPAHVDEPMAEASRLGPAHRFRKVKGSQGITPAITRGVKNNGHIEVDWADEPEDSNDSGWPDPESFGRTYKLPMKSIVLDFVEQLRRQGAGYGPRENEPKGAPYLAPPFLSSEPVLRGSDLGRKVSEMQLSLNLISLRQKPTEGIDRLTTALMAGADPNMLNVMAQSNAQNIASGDLTDTDRQGLRALLAQMEAMGTRIREVLGDGDSTPRAQHSSGKETTPTSDAHGLNGFHDKSEPTAPVTEPTPPSTIDQTEVTMEVD